MRRVRQKHNYYQIRVFAQQELQKVVGSAILDILSTMQRLASTLTEVVQEWLQGRGAKPVSWRTLTRILKAVKLTVLAQDITDTLYTLSKEWILAL